MFLLGKSKKKSSKITTSESNISTRAVSLQPAVDNLPLHNAIEANDSQAFNNLLNQATATDLTAKDSRGRTPLHLAVQRQREEMVDALLQQKAVLAHLNDQDDSQKTVLHHAIQTNQQALVLQLLAMDIDWKLTDGIGQSLLHICAQIGHLDLLRQLLAPLSVEQRKEIVQKQDADGRTPLHLAAMQPDAAVVNYLLEAGSEVNVLNHYAYTPLHFAVRHMHLDIVSALLTNGANPELKNADGQTPLDIAKCYGRVGIISVLELAQMPSAVTEADDSLSDAYIIVDKEMATNEASAAKAGATNQSATLWQNAIQPTSKVILDKSNQTNETTALQENTALSAWIAETLTAYQNFTDAVKSGSEQTAGLFTSFISKLKTVLEKQRATKAILNLLFPLGTSTEQLIEQFLAELPQWQKSYWQAEDDHGKWYVQQLFKAWSEQPMLLEKLALVVKRIGDSYLVLETTEDKLTATQLAKAQLFYQMALFEGAKFLDVPQLRVDLLIAIGNCLTQQGKYLEATRHLVAAMKLAEQAKFNDEREKVKALLAEVTYKAAQAYATECPAEQSQVAINSIVTYKTEMSGAGSILFSNQTSVEDTAEANEALQLTSSSFLIDKPPAIFPHSWECYRERLQAIRQHVKHWLDDTTWGSWVKTSSLQQWLTQHLVDVFKDILIEAVNHIGLPPCEYAVLGLGSLAREEACPYSDLEFALLLERYGKEEQAYFKALVLLIHMTIISLGETPLKEFSFIEIPAGFCFDDGGHIPFCKECMIGTASTMIQSACHFQAGKPSDFHAFDVLFSARLLFGSKKADVLYKDYKQLFQTKLSEIPNGFDRSLRDIYAEFYLDDVQELLSKQYSKLFTVRVNDVVPTPGDASTELKSEQIKLKAPASVSFIKLVEDNTVNLNESNLGRQEDNLLATEVEEQASPTPASIKLDVVLTLPSTLNVKTHLTRLMVFLANTLAIYEELTMINTQQRLDQLVTLQRLSAILAHAMKTQLELAFRIRIAAHIAAGGEQDILALAPNQPGYQVSTQERQMIEQIFKTIIKPLWIQLDALRRHWQAEQIDSIEQNRSWLARIFRKGDKLNNPLLDNKPFGAVIDLYQKLTEQALLLKQSDNAESYARQALAVTKLPELENDMHLLNQQAKIQALHTAIEKAWKEEQVRCGYLYNQIQKALKTIHEEYSLIPTKKVHVKAEDSIVDNSSSFIHKDILQNARVEQLALVKQPLMLQVDAAKQLLALIRECLKKGLNHPAWSLQLAKLEEHLQEHYGVDIKLELEDIPADFSPWAVTFFHLLVTSLRFCSWEKARVIYREVYLTLKTEQVRMYWYQLGQRIEASDSNRSNWHKQMLGSYPKADGSRQMQHEAELIWQSGIDNLVKNYNMKLTDKGEANTSQGISLHIPSKGSCDLPLALAEQLFEDNANIKRTNKQGQRAVHSITWQGQNYYFKQNPELPGIEYAVNRLHDLMVGHGTAKTMLMAIDNPQKKSRYPVLVSQGIAGRTLQQVLRESPAGIPNLDVKQYSQMVIMALLTSPEDGKSDNYIVQEVINDKGQKVSYIIGIDNDHAFVGPVARVGLTIKAHVKTLLFCFDEMTQPIDQEAREELLALNPYTVLTNWLVDVKEQDELYQKLFTSEQKKALLKNKDKEQRVCIATLFKKGVIEALYEKLTLLQYLLKHNTDITHIELLQHLEPLLSTYYEEALRKPIAPAERFRQVTEKAYGGKMEYGAGKTVANTSRSLQSMLGKIPTIEEIEKGKHSLAKTIKELEAIKQEEDKIDSTIRALREGDTQPFLDLKHHHIREQVISRISRRIGFDKLLSENKQDLMPEQQEVLEQLQQAIIKAIIKSRTAFKVLRLRNCTVLTQADLDAIIANSSGLILLDIEGCAKIREGNAFTAGIEQTLKQRCAKLQKLYLGRTRISKLEVSLPRLRRLHVNEANQLQLIDIKAPQLRYINAKDCSKLKRVYAQSYHNVETLFDGCDELEKSVDLRSKKIMVNTLPSSVKRLAEDLVTVQLNLSSNQLGGEGAKVLAKVLEVNTTLTQLDLSGNLLGNEGVKVLAKALEVNTRLTQLHLYNNELGSEGAKVLAKALEVNTTLTQLHLSGNLLGDEGAKVLAKALEVNTRLTQLELHNNELGSEGAKVLAKALEVNTTLTQLDLSPNQLGDEGGKTYSLAKGYCLRNRLMLNPYTPSLNLSSNQIGDEGAKILAKSLAVNTTLVQLIMHHNCLGMEGIKALTKALKNNTKLLQLDLSGNLISEEHIIYSSGRGICIRNRLLQESHNSWLDLGDSLLGAKGMKHVAKALDINLGLNYLFLRNNKLGNKGTKVLASALINTRKLILLDLENNQLGDKGAKALAKTLISNYELIQLNLGNNHIGPKGAIALASSLKSKTKLTKLDLSWNRLEQEGVETLAEMLRSNVGLTDVNLDNNYANNSIVTSIKESFRSNAQQENQQANLIQPQFYLFSKRAKSAYNTVGSSSINFFKLASIADRTNSHTVMGHSDGMFSDDSNGRNEKDKILQVNSSVSP